MVICYIPVSAEKTCAWEVCIFLRKISVPTKVIFHITGQEQTEQDLEICAIQLETKTSNSTTYYTCTQFNQEILKKFLRRSDATLK
jgi:hypothetical protein